MGTRDFMATAMGKTAQEAFENAVETARHEYGNRGYTGTIAEKDEFIMVTVPKGNDPYQYAQNILNNEQHTVSDKYGPAGCILLNTTKEKEFVERPPIKTKVTKMPSIGTRKWETVYVLKKDGIMLEKLKRKTQVGALTLAKELALKDPGTYEILIMKLPVDQDPVIMSVTPVKRNPIVQQVEVGSYLFFGYAEE